MTLAAMGCSERLQNRLIRRRQRLLPLPQDPDSWQTLLSTSDPTEVAR
jgi:hypothetical protein